MMNEQATNRAIERYADMVRRICVVYLKNKEDTEDIFQEVFLKYLLRQEDFQSHAHEKAWLIRVTINSCKDLLKSFFRKRVYRVDSMNEIEKEPGYAPPRAENNDREALDAVLSLPEKYRQVIYLQYYEGYAVTEIAKILNKNENTIYTWSSRAKQRLRKILGGELNE